MDRPGLLEFNGRPKKDFAGNAIAPALDDFVFCRQFVCVVVME